MQIIHQSFVRTYIAVVTQTVILNSSSSSNSGRGVLKCVISGFRHEVAANGALLGYYAATRANRYSLRNNPEERSSKKC